jgi:hypothetical protein
MNPQERLQQQFNWARNGDFPEIELRQEFRENALEPAIFVRTRRGETRFGTALNAAFYIERLREGARGPRTPLPTPTDLPTGAPLETPQQELERRMDVIRDRLQNVEPDREMREPTITRAAAEAEAVREATAARIQAMRDTFGQELPREEPNTPWPAPQFRATVRLDAPVPPTPAPANLSHNDFLAGKTGF